MELRPDLHDDETLRSTLESEGLAEIPSWLDRDEISHVRRILENLQDSRYRKSASGVRFALRHVQRDAPELGSWLIEGPPGILARRVQGNPVALVTATLFDKRPGANWKVPFHQDRLFPVRGATADDSWVGWSRKDGIQHVEPPVPYQREMLALRIALDDGQPGSGGLEVVPGTHRERLPDARIQELASSSSRLLESDAGDALLMRPLLLHRSGPARVPTRRRVLHVVYASRPLPQGLAWI